MTKEELSRLSEASKILGAINKIAGQLENLKKCDLVQISGIDENRQRIMFDIQCSDRHGHPFRGYAKEFIESYQIFLNGRLNELQEKFDAL